MSKRLLRGSNLKWLSDHEDIVERFADEFIDMDSHDDFFYLVYEQYPSQFVIILKDFIERLNKKVDEVIRCFIFGKKIMYVVGARDSGKTCFSFWLAEQIHIKLPNKKIAYVGVHIEKDLLPEWIDVFDDINDVPNGYLILLDELALCFNARKFSSEDNVSLGKLLAISRQKDLSVVAITQDPNMGEINVWRLKDIVVYKRSNTYELPSRDNKKSSEIIQFWSYIKNWLKPSKQEQALLEYPAESKVILFKYPLPSFWTERLSKAFHNVDVRKQEIEEPKPQLNKVKYRSRK